MVEFTIIMDSGQTITGKTSNDIPAEIRSLMSVYVRRLYGFHNDAGSEITIRTDQISVLIVHKEEK